MISVVLISAAILTSGLRVDDGTRARYADDISSTSPDLETAMAMVATIKAEAERDPTRIERCDCHGAECDRGKAASLYQLHEERWQGRTKAEVCGSNRVASQLAADFLSHLRRATGSWGAAFQRFVGCSTRACKELRGRDVMFFRLLANARKAGA